MLPAMGETALARPRYGHLGKVLFVDLTESNTGSNRSTSRSTGATRGYGLGAWLMWKHFPPGTDPSLRRLFCDLLGSPDRAADPVLGPDPDRRQVAADRDVGRLELGRQRVQSPARGRL